LVEAAQDGVRVILSTTRTPFTTCRFAAEIGLADPVICTNGALVLGSPSGPVWQQRAIPTQVAEALVSQADCGGYPLITTAGDVTYHLRQDDQLPGESRPGHRTVARNLDALDSGDVVTRVLCYDLDGIAELQATCASRFPEQVHTETYLRPDGSVKSTGIFAAGSDKGTALRFVAGRLGVELAQTMAIGDNPNDLPMFACAGVRVAMGNATGSVKAAATAVAPTNDEGGVAWAVERYVLGG